MRALAAGMVMAVLMAPGLFGTLETRAQGPEDLINLLWPDDHARRSMKVITKSGGELRGLQMIKAYDQNRRTFIMTTVTGESRTIPATGVERIEFSQHLIRQPQYAQMAREEIQVHRGAERTVKIPARDFQVQDGYLVGRYLSAPPKTKTAPRGNIVNLEDLDLVKPVPEVRSIAYDPQTDTFVVTMQAVQYVRKFLGGGGGVMEGGGKGVQ